MTQNLIVNEELKTLLPPLSAEEFAGLEESILKDGCLSPLVVWDDILVDGYHRYEICTKHQIPFAVKSVVLDSIDDAKFWAWQHQQHRRNLTAYYRAELALKLKDTIAAKARARQLGSLKQNTVVPTLVQREEASRTREELAEIADVSHGNLSKVEYITAHADKDTKEKLRHGEKGTSINKEYNRLKAEAKATIEPDPKPVDESADDDTYPAPPCPNKDVKYFPKTTLKLIPQESPQVLISRLFELFREGFVEEMVVMAMDMLAEEKGKDAVKTILAQLNKKHGKK